MKAIHIALGVAAIGLTGAAALFGAWCWWRVRNSAWFWRVLRAAQAAVVLQAALGGVLVILGHKPPGLHVLYGVLPLLVSLLAEGFRATSAQMVLDARGHASAEEVGRLPPEEQRVIVLSILHRELGVMVLAAVVNVVLLARAAATA
jgi:heme A synthase